MKVRTVLAAAPLIMGRLGCCAPRGNLEPESRDLREIPAWLVTGAFCGRSLNVCGDYPCPVQLDSPNAPAVSFPWRLLPASGSGIAESGAPGAFPDITPTGGY